MSKHKHHKHDLVDLDELGKVTATDYRFLMAAVSVARHQRPGLRGALDRLAAVARRYPHLTLDS